MINIRYFGGKARTCKEISKIINTYIYNNELFISPFVGGGWVEQYINTNNKLLFDKHPYLIDMYKALQKGWIPPTNLTKEEYTYIKNHLDEKPYLSGFVGFGCSFAGKWFGGYAKDKTRRNYCLNSYNSILNKMNNGLKNAKFECKDYRELKPRNAIVYCDPPYKGTTQYSKKIVGNFNTYEFWNIIREWSKYNKIFISEYNAPDDFECVWQQSVKLDIRNKNNIKEKRIEKLFTYKN